MKFEIKHVSIGDCEGFSLVASPGYYYKHGEFIARGFEFAKDGRVTVRNAREIDGGMWYRWPSIAAAKLAIPQYVLQYNLTEKYDLAVRENGNIIFIIDSPCGKIDTKIEEDVLDDDHDPERGFLEDLSAAFPEL